MPASLDALARRLGAAPTRRDALRALGAAAGTAALGSVGLGLPSTAAAGATGAGVCDVLPDGLPFCSDNAGCVCVDTPGGRACAEVTYALCDTPACTTDADCAGFGPAFFCGSSVYEPFCDDGRGRCMAPCGHTDVGGSWAGTATYAGQTSNVRFELVDDRGALTGRVLTTDPVTGAWIDLGPLRGDRSVDGYTGDADVAYGGWTTTTGLHAGGTFDHGAFTGLLQFAPVRGHGEAFTADLRLTRVGDPVGVDPEPSRPAPTRIALGAPYPNPARADAVVTVPVDVAAPGPVRVAAYDALGREVAVLHDGPLGVGLHPLRWTAPALPAGVYVVRAQSGPVASVRTVTLVR